MIYISEYISYQLYIFLYILTKTKRTLFQQYVNKSECQFWVHSRFSNCEQLTA